ncbi:Ig-like domain-containing protein [Vibrio chagasii]|nr:Ig-like domain-containing protein [Vibrio chagasii]
MGITKDRYGVAMPFFTPEQQLSAGTYYVQFAVISTVEAGEVIYNGGDRIQVLAGEVIAIPRGIISVEVSVDFRAAGKFSTTPLEMPKITKQPEDVSVADGGEATLTVHVDANATDLQWFKDDTELSGETTNTLTIAAVEPSDEGDYYLQVGNALGHINTNTVRIDITTKV